MKQTIENVVPAAKSWEWDNLLVIVLATGTISILAWLLKYSHYGIDFTDEGYYLVSIVNPYLYDWSVTQFGFIYHPLYKLLEGNISGLRQANILLTFFLALLLVGIFLKKLVPDISSHWVSWIVIAAGFATGSLVFVDTWMPTPSYNSLALQGVLLVATGLLMAESERSRSSQLGWVLIGVGGWLAFMAKPSTAAALGFLAVVYLVLTKKTEWRMILLAVGTSLMMLILSALLIDGSVGKFVSRMSSGASHLDNLGSGHALGEIIRLDSFDMKSNAVRLFAFMTFVLVCMSLLLRSSVKVRRYLGLMIYVLMHLFVLGVTLGQLNENIRLGEYKGMLLWVIPLSSVALIIFVCRGKLIFKVPSLHWAIALTFVVIPHVYAFGTNRNYWVNGSWAGLFWVLAGLVLLVPLVRVEDKRSVFLPFALATQVIAVFLIHSGMGEPYRQNQPLWENNHLLEFGSPGSMLVLSEGYATYIKEAVTSARQVGFEAGAPMIDLTGQSPGILYSLQAESIGSAWIIGNLTGSLALATVALRHVPCEKLSNAWLLMEPDGPRSIPGELLESFGADLIEDYSQVASWVTAEGAGGYEQKRLQILLKPTRAQEVAVQACRDKRVEIQS